MNLWYWWRSYKLRLKHAKDLAWVNKIEKEYFNKCYKEYPELSAIRDEIVRNCRVYKETYDPVCLKELDRLLLKKLIPHCLNRIIVQLEQIDKGKYEVR